MYLNPEANTKHKVLQTLNSQYELIGIYLPVLNRAKFFLHSLQLDKNLNWDDWLGSDHCREWVRICKHVTSRKDIQLNMCVGNLHSTFKLIGSADASKDVIGVVFYLWDEENDQCSFIQAKSRVLGKDLKSKSIPVL